MKIEDLTAFVAVIRLQSTRLAADELGLTQPAITRRVQNFEESLGIPLLNRQTKPLKPGHPHECSLISHLGKSGQYYPL